MWSGAGEARRALACGVLWLEAISAFTLGTIPAVVVACSPGGTGLSSGEKAHTNGVPAVNVNDTSTTTVTWNMQTGGQGSSSATAKARGSGTTYNSTGSASAGGWDSGTFTVPAGTDIESIEFTYVVGSATFKKKMIFPAD